MLGTTAVPNEPTENVPELIVGAGRFGMFEVDRRPIRGVFEATNDARPLT